MIGRGSTKGSCQEVKSDSLMNRAYVLISKQSPFASGTGRSGQQKKTDYSRLVKVRAIVVMRDVLWLYGVVGQLSVMPGVFF